ncbi:hypothetical protein GOHSU_21_00150 [Gordonia hirsuta DSM 44140 = NBRC 16056]|uniref:Uncharacterized protein n=1 Tax=Gordonia hirsuta DSM 44140 = NBRC 16056 TaxID=1121927 RepID=L7LBX8_9ACTN|nr:hypothetical protein [Gordonia hirsuta]GAC57523.1 hypothetical protein GOHSU_21_00150 [Gordonia hirsuta DSM 44140 = NBRC 16056]
MRTQGLWYPVGTIVLGALLVVWTATDLSDGETNAMTWITLVIGAVGIALGIGRLVQTLRDRTD